MKKIFLTFLLTLTFLGVFSQTQAPTEQHNPWYFVNGPVAIGLTTPAYTLDVLGNTNVRGYQYSYSQSTTGSRELYKSGTTFSLIPNSYGFFQGLFTDTANPQAPFFIDYFGRGSPFGNPTPLVFLIMQSSDTVKNTLSFSGGGFNINSYGVVNSTAFSTDSSETRVKDVHGNDMLNINSNSNVSLGDGQKYESGTGVDINVPGQFIIAQTEGFFEVDDTDANPYFTVSVSSNKTTISSALQFTGSTGAVGTVATNSDGSGNISWLPQSFSWSDTTSVLSTQPFAENYVSAHALSNKGIIGTSSTPTIAAGTGAGTSPTISINGTNISGLITVTPGIGGATSATLVTVTYNGLTFNTGSLPIINPYNSAAALLTGVTMVYASGTTTTFKITTGTTGLTSGVTYSWSYIVSGY